jgi:hypothetical protein
MWLVLEHSYTTKIYAHQHEYPKQSPPPINFSMGLAKRMVGIHRSDPARLKAWIFMLLFPRIWLFSPRLSTPFMRLPCPLPPNLSEVRSGRKPRFGFCRSNRRSHALESRASWYPPPPPLAPFLVPVLVRDSEFLDPVQFLHFSLISPFQPSLLLTFEPVSRKVVVSLGSPSQSGIFSCTFF